MDSSEAHLTVEGEAEAEARGPEDLTDEEADTLVGTVDDTDPVELIESDEPPLEPVWSELDTAPALDPRDLEGVEITDEPEDGA